MQIMKNMFISAKDYDTIKYVKEQWQQVYSINALGLQNGLNSRIHWPTLKTANNRIKMSKTANEMRIVDK